MAHVGSKLLKIKDYEIEFTNNVSTKHKTPVGATRELVAGGEMLETAVGVSHELFFVGNETHEASVGATRELAFIAGRETRKPEKEVDCVLADAGHRSLKLVQDIPQLHDGGIQRNETKNNKSH